MWSRKCLVGVFGLGIACSGRTRMSFLNINVTFEMSYVRLVEVVE